MKRFGPLRIGRLDTSSMALSQAGHGGTGWVHLEHLNRLENLLDNYPSACPMTFYKHKVCH